MADDTFRLDLSDQDAEFIRETLEGFLESSGHYARTVIEIRMGTAMRRKLGIEGARCSFRGIPIALVDLGAEGTVEDHALTATAKA